MTGGLVAARTAAQSCTGNEYGDSSLNELIQRANQRIGQLQLHDGTGLQERHKLWSTSCGVVRLTGRRLESCQTGDALIIFILSDGACRVVTPDIGVDGETLQLWKEMQVAQNARMQEVLAKQLRKVRLEMNVRYGVLYGEPEALAFIRHGYEDLTDVSDVLLVSDGLHIPPANPCSEHDWQSFVELYRYGGL